MGTTNILDLNNRLTKVEKENVAQNSYTSLKNKPKINSVTLSGNKSLADIGAAAAADVGSLSALTTTDKSSCVGAINELKSGLTNVNSNLLNRAAYKTVTFSGTGADPSTISISDMANKVGLLVLSTYSNYAIYIIYRESTSSQFVHKISDSGTYAPTVTLLGDVLTINNTDIVGGGAIFYYVADVTN